MQLQVFVQDKKDHPLQETRTPFEVMHIRNKLQADGKVSNYYFGGITTCAFLGDKGRIWMEKSICNVDTDGYSRRLGILTCAERFLNRVSPSGDLIQLKGYRRSDRETWQVEVFVQDRKTAEAELLKIYEILLENFLLAHPYADLGALQTPEAFKNNLDYRRLNELAVQRSRGEWCRSPRPKKEKTKWKKPETASL